jgi:hypothetical protein
VITAPGDTGMFTTSSIPETSLLLVGLIVAILLPCIVLRNARAINRGVEKGLRCGLWSCLVALLVLLVITIIFARDQYFGIDDDPPPPIEVHTRTDSIGEVGIAQVLAD